MFQPSSISIHALREEGDMAAVCNVASVTGFLSTPSARRATSLDPLHMVLRLISIHALREEGDHITSTVKYTAAQISIHALREEGDQHEWS